MSRTPTPPPNPLTPSTERPPLHPELPTGAAAETAKRSEWRGKACPCGGGSAHFETCCEPYHLGGAAPTAVVLMRSRYSAYVVGDVEYLRATWHPRTRPAQLHLEPQQKWLGLKVVGHSDGAATDSTGQVHFVARYKIAGRGHRLVENARFERLNKRWVYVDGDLM